jgi:N-acylglucosamine-6-phosphate 2-epimerase
MMRSFKQQIKGGLIVSCQALPGEPLYHPDFSLMPFLAIAAEQAGAVGLRANSVRDIKAIKAKVKLPLIGIIKKQYPGFPNYITASMKEIDDLVKCGVDVIALDCTFGPRKGFASIDDFIKAIKKKYPNQKLMADISNLKEGINADKLKVDFISTTLSGYTKDSPKQNGPDLKLIKDLSRKVKAPIIAEGKIHSPEQARAIIELGAWAVVVGGAITRPLEIATRFVKALKD